MPSVIRISLLCVAATAVRVRLLATGGDLVDITDFIKTKEREPHIKTFKRRGQSKVTLNGVRCCCDAPDYKKIADWGTGKKRSGGCQVFETGFQSQCSDQKAPSWAGGRTLRHYIHNNGRCQVPSEDVPDILSKYGTPDNYCKAVQPDPTSLCGQLCGGFVEAAARFERPLVMCKPGYEGTPKKVECAFATVSEGKYVPEPICTWKQDWCPEVHAHAPPGRVQGEEGIGPQVFKVNSAALGAHPVVECPDGRKLTAPVVCAENRQLVPKLSTSICD